MISNDISKTCLYYDLYLKTGIKNVLKKNNEANKFLN